VHGGGKYDEALMAKKPSAGALSTEDLANEQVERTWRNNRAQSVNQERAQNQVTGGLEEMLAAKLAQLKSAGGPHAQRPLMLGDENESPWTGIPDELARKAKRTATGLLEIPGGQRRTHLQTSFSEQLPKADPMNADRMYQMNLKKLQAAQCAITGNGEQRHGMMSGEQNLFEPSKEPDNSQLEEELKPKGRGPEIGYGLERPIPFHPIESSGDLVPSRVMITKLPGYTSEIFPDEAQLNGSDEYDGVSAEVGASTDRNTKHESMPAAALISAALAPALPRSTQRSLGTRCGKFRCHERRANARSFL
jgi:hypothetical protein